MCDQETGRAGKDEDSIYDQNGCGPFCVDCWMEYKKKLEIKRMEVTPGNIERTLFSEIFYDETYKCPFVFCSNGSKLKAYNELRINLGLDTEDLDLSDPCGSFISVNGHYGGCIWVKDFDIKEPASLATLMHECVHAAMYVFDFVGVDISIQNEEAFCYYAECLFRNYIKSFRKEG